MSVEPFDPSTISYVRLFPWIRLFRAVGLALDSKKLLLATLGLTLSSSSSTPGAWTSATRTASSS